MPLGGRMTVVGAVDVRRMYDDFYRFLADAGVSGAKTDVQFMTDTWEESWARRGLAGDYLDAWTVASLRHLGGRTIASMSQTPMNIFCSQLRHGARPPFPVRASDDFFPFVETSHAWHLWANSHNVLLLQHLNVLPDWDMFTTVHPYAGYHAAARCVSGGPVFITDVPGSHDLGLIGQMTAVTPRGKTVVLRPSVLGKSIDTYVSYSDEVLLKVGACHGASAPNQHPQSRRSESAAPSWG